MKNIYLDHNATTPVDPSVVEAMLPFLNESYGNSSSVHSFGRDSKVALERSREFIADFIGCEPSELFFTSGGTESDNIAILGSADYYSGRKNHLIIGATEHHAILEPAEHLEKIGKCELTILPVDNFGMISADTLNAELKDSTFLVSIMHANNETGTIQDIATLAEIVRKRNILFHTDAVQSIGKIPVNVNELNVDMLSLTGHKIYGPKGTGALYIRSGIKISPLFFGGSQEKKRRPGTENVAGVVGLAKSLEIAESRRQEDTQRLSELADYFVKSILNTISDCHLNGHPENRIPYTANISFDGIEGESIVLGLDMEHVAVASGSACTSGAIEPSHVLTAMSVPVTSAQGAIRFSLGRSTTKGDIDHVLNVLPQIVNRLREMSPIYRQSQ